MNNDIYSYEFEVLVQALYVAADDCFLDEIVDTGMLPLELEQLSDISEDEFKQDWIYDRVKDWIMRGLEDD